MDKSKAARYLKRIGINLDLDNVIPDYKLLCRLQHAHVTAVPYENLDIIRRIPLNLSVDALYDKIVISHRGGYCFELNALYNDLLKTLGYTTVNYFARYLRGESDIPMRRHRVMAATSPYLESPVICDVGIGDRSPRYPVPLRADVLNEQFGEQYQFTQDDEFGWVLTDYHKGAWEVFFAFTEEKQYEIDYSAVSYWCENHPDSPFRNKIIVSLKNDLGRKTLSGMVYKQFEAGDLVVERTLEDKLDLYRVLDKEFSIII